MSRLAHALAALCGVAALGLVGCNAVLGIDEAHSRTDSLSGAGPVVIPVPGCDAPNLTCGGCVADSNALKDCELDHKCRKSLDNYRACLGAACNDTSCFDTFATSAGQAVADIVSAECPMCEGASPLASMCDLYCACMEQPLPASTPGALSDGATCESFNGSSLPWAAGTLTACKDACNALAKKDLASVNCRWGHCELAANGETRAHCGHAIDDSVCPLSAVANPDCKDRALSGWACDVNADCCSMHCAGNICAQ